MQRTRPLGVFTYWKFHSSQPLHIRMTTGNATPPVQTFGCLGGGACAPPHAAAVEPACPYPRPPPRYCTYRRGAARCLLPHRPSVTPRSRRRFASRGGSAAGARPSAPPRCGGDSPPRGLCCARLGRAGGVRVGGVAAARPDRHDGAAGVHPHRWGWTGRLREPRSLAVCVAVVCLCAAPQGARPAACGKRADRRPLTGGCHAPTATATPRL